MVEGLGKYILLESLRVNVFWRFYSKLILSVTFLGNWIWIIALLTEAVEYADCTSAERVSLATNETTCWLWVATHDA